MSTENEGEWTTLVLEPDEAPVDEYLTAKSCLLFQWFVGWFEGKSVTGTPFSHPLSTANCPVVFPIEYLMSKLECMCRPAIIEVDKL